MAHPFGHKQRPALWVLVGLCLTIFLYFFRIQGLFLALPLVAVMGYISSHSPNEPEARSLRQSIDTSLDDIRDVLDAYDTFLHGTDADSVADRTLHRPQLANFDTEDPTIQVFLFQQSTARRFLNRLNARLASTNVDVPELESLLAAADRRGHELKLAWLDARRAAQRLGPEPS